MKVYALDIDRYPNETETLLFRKKEDARKTLERIVKETMNNREDDMELVQDSIDDVEVATVRWKRDEWEDEKEWLEDSVEVELMIYEKFVH